MTELLDEASLQVIRQVLAGKKSLPGALLPILHEIQASLGYVPPQAIGEIARELNLSRAEVHGVVSYYADFRSQPGPPNKLQICRAEACQAMGGEKLWSHACAHLGCATEQAGPTAGGEFSLEPVYCLGMCAASPAMRLNQKPHARVDAEKFDALVLAARSGKLP